MSVTQGERQLKKHKVPFKALEYDCRVKGAEYAAEALGRPLEATFKTLIVALPDKSFVVCVMPGDRELSLKKLARITGAKSARMSTPEEAQKQSGYLVGGISPFGTKKRMEVYLHETIMDFETIGINGGRRGLMFLISPSDVKMVLNATVADIAA
ncbi:MAG: Cys-tRNA(Pro) deacylase [Deltaproteobacteria bacterium]|nr:MAG: Cys-tRNA(Pro) deacylase [Deltaproteobacteria bacterium]